MPSKHSRSLARGRPPLGEGGCWGKYGAIRCHCSSERTRLVIRAMIDSFGRSLKRHQPNRAIPVLKPSLGNLDAIVTVWDIKTGKEYATFSGHTSSVDAI